MSRRNENAHLHNHKLAEHKQRDLTNTTLATIATNTANIKLSADSVNLNVDGVEGLLAGGLPSALTGSGNLKVCLQELGNEGSERLNVDIGDTNTRLPTQLTGSGNLKVSIQETFGGHIATEAKQDSLIAANHTDLVHLSTDLDTVATKLDSIISNTAAIVIDGDAIQVNTDGLETLVTSSNTKLDTLEASLTSMEGKIDTLDAVLDASLVKHTNNETLLTAGNVDHAANEVLLTAIAADGDAIQTKLDTLETSANAIQSAVEGTLTVASHAVTNAGTFAVQAVCSGTVTANLSATDNAVLDASLVKQTNIETLVTQLDVVADNSLTKLTEIDTAIDTIDSVLDASLVKQTNIETSVQLIDDIVLAEDAAHSSGQKGVMFLGVRQSSQADFSADGDYTPLSIDDDGKLRTTGATASTTMSVDTLMDNVTIAANATTNSSVFTKPKNVLHFAVLATSASGSGGFVLKKSQSVDGTTFIEVPQNQNGGSARNVHIEESDAVYKFFRYSIENLEVGSVNHTIKVCY